MKKILAALLALELAFSLAGCKKDEAAPKEIEALDTVAAPVRTVYAADTLEGPEQVWLVDRLAVLGDQVYFAGGQWEDTVVFRAGRDGSGAAEIARFQGGNLWDLCAGDGRVYLLMERRGLEPEGWELRILDENGAETGNIPLGGEGWPEGWTPVSAAYSGGVLALTGEGGLCGLDPENPAQPLFTVEAGYSARLAELPGGGFALGESTDTGYSLRFFDTAGNRTGQLLYDESFSCPYTGGDRFGLYLTDGSSLYGCDPVHGDLEKLLSWQSCGLSGGVVLESGEADFLCLAALNSAAAPRLIRLRAVELEGEVRPLVLATMSSFTLDLYLGDALKAWNRAHPESPIQVRDYALYADGSDPRAAQLRLLTDIAGGDVPDLFDLSAETDAETGLEPFSTGLLARRGLLEDLYPWLDGDGELSRDRLFSGPLAALEIGGALYELPVRSEYIFTAADPARVGPESGWTYETLRQTAGDAPLFGSGEERIEFLETALSCSGDKLVDWGQGRCCFDSDYFRQILETAMAQPASAGSGGGGRLEDILRQSDALLFPLWMDSVTCLETAMDVYGPDFALVGLPELGTALYPQLSLGISGGSENKEACWQFLRQFLLPGADPNGLSLNREALFEARDRALLRNQEEGNAQFHPNAEAACTRFLEAWDRVDAVYRFDAQLWDIVRSEAERTFAGQISPAEAAANIQSRASIYLSEQS